MKLPWNREFDEAVGRMKELKDLKSWIMEREPLSSECRYLHFIAEMLVIVHFRLWAIMISSAMAVGTLISILLR